MSHLKGPKPTDQWRSGQSLSFINNLKTAKAHGLSVEGERGGHPII
jgi:hypothetical protein